LIIPKPKQKPKRKKKQVVIHFYPIDGAIEAGDHQQLPLSHHKRVLILKLKLLMESYVPQQHL